jgi:hypothetical protein
MPLKLEIIEKHSDHKKQSDPSESLITTKLHENLIHTTTQSLIFFQTPSQVGRKTRREIII